METVSLGMATAMLRQRIIYLSWFFLLSFGWQKPLFYPSGFSKINPCMLLENHLMPPQPHSQLLSSQGEPFSSPEISLRNFRSSGTNGKLQRLWQELSESVWGQMSNTAVILRKYVESQEDFHARMGEKERSLRIIRISDNVFFFFKH